MHNLSNCAPRSEWNGGSSARYQLRARMVPKQPMIFQSGVPSKRSSDDIFVCVGKLTRIAERSKLLGWSEQEWEPASLSAEGILIPSLRNIALDDCRFVNQHSRCFLEGFSLVRAVFLISVRRYERISLIGDPSIVGIVETRRDQRHRTLLEHTAFNGIHQSLQQAPEIEIGNVGAHLMPTPRARADCLLCQDLYAGRT